MDGLTSQGYTPTGKERISIMRWIAAGFLVFLSNMAAAQCPLQLTEVCPLAHNTNWGAVLGSGGDELDRDGYGMKIQFLNTSRNTIKAAEFSMSMIDAALRRRESSKTYVVTKVAKPDKKVAQFFLPPEYLDPSQLHDNAAFRRHQYFEQTKNGIEISLTRVVFEDGSTWDPDPKVSCSLESRASKQ